MSLKGEEGAMAAVERLYKENNGGLKKLATAGDRMFEITLTEKELEYLYFAIENYRPLDGIENLTVEEQFGLYESTRNKFDREFIAGHIFDLLGDIDCLEGYDGPLGAEWHNKLWRDEEEGGNTTLVKRNAEMWTWDTVGKLQSLVEELEAKNG